MTLSLLAGSAVVGGSLVSLANLLSGEGLYIPLIFFGLLGFLVLVTRWAPPLVRKAPWAGEVRAAPAPVDAPRGAARPAVRTTRVLAVGAPLALSLPALASPGSTVPPLAMIALVQVGLSPYALRRWQQESGRVLLVPRHPTRANRGQLWWAPAEDEAVRT